MGHYDNKKRIGKEMLHHFELKPQMTENEEKILIAKMCFLYGGTERMVKKMIEQAIELGYVERIISTEKEKQ